MPRVDLTGIVRTATGWRVYVRVRPLPPATRRFPADTPQRVLIEARDELRAELRKQRNADARLAPTAGTFAADATRYLAAVASMPSYRDRAWQIQQWVARFGQRHRRAITSADIRTALAEWQQAGYAARTLNHFRGALLHLYNTLDGKAAANPVRDVPAARPPDDMPRDMPDDVMTAILAQIQPSKVRAVLRVMAACGMTPTEIGRIEPADIRGDVLIARGRRKGAGTRPRALPITPALAEALEEFRAADAWGGVSKKTVGAAWRLARRKAGYPDVKAYDLRHTYLTGISAEGDDRVTQYLGGHSTPKMTQRYTLGSVPERVALVVASVVAKRDGRRTGSEKSRENTQVGETADSTPELAKIKPVPTVRQAKPRRP